MIKKISTRIQSALLVGVRGLRRAVDAIESAIRWVF